MNASPDLVLMAEHARTYREVIDANADRDFSGSTARQVRISTVLNHGKAPYVVHEQMFVHLGEEATNCNI